MCSEDISKLACLFLYWKLKTSGGDEMVMEEEPMMSLTLSASSPRQNLGDQNS